MDHGAQVQGEVRHDVHGRKHFEHRQRGDRCQCVAEQLERGLALLGAVHDDVAAGVAHDLADARRAVDVRDDLQQEARHLERLEELGLSMDVQAHARANAVARVAGDLLASTEDANSALRTQLRGNAATACQRLSPSDPLCGWSGVNPVWEAKVLGRERGRLAAR